MRERISARGVGAGVTIGAAGLLAYRVLAREREWAAEPERATYPPLDTPKRIAENVWIVDSGPLRAMGLTMPVRMTVVRLADGDLLLHSPTPFTPDLARAIEALGTVRHLVAPNIAHWMFLVDWQRTYPAATTWGAPGLRDRGQVRRSGVRIDVELGEQAPAEWAADLTQGVVPGGGGFREVYFFHKPTRTLLLVDLVQDLEPAKLPPVTRALMRASAATRGTTALHVRAALMLGGGQAKEAIRAMVALEPERVVFAHGRVFAEGGAERLRRAFEWLL